ncbi:MAG: FAD-binding protein [Pirellulales bacterium]|nr:FAD-binding protein [Pirellulales bacterium]
MDRERQRIEEDLRGLIAGEVRCDPVFRQLYATDASLFAMDPLGVVRPRTTADVVAVVQYAAAGGIPVHPRGAGSGLAGGTVGPGLVLDFSRFMRRVLQTTETTVRVQPGVVLENLNRHLAKYGRRFGPDPATSEVRTMGGVVSVNASGNHWLRSGSARNQLIAAEVVLADGSVVELGDHSVQPRTDGGEPVQLSQRIRSLAILLDEHADEIARHQPKTHVNSCGYHLHHVLQDGEIHLPRLLAGSEGTLAVVTQATLKTEPIAPIQQCVIFLFDRLEKAAFAVAEILPLAPTACDLMDRRHINLARESDIRFELMVSGAAEALLLVEFEGSDPREVSHRVKKAVDRISHETGLAAGSYIADEPEDIALCWDLARGFAPTLYRMKGNSRPVPFVEDIAVPPMAVAKMLAFAQNILKRLEVTASLFAHAGQGQIHIRPLINISDPQDRYRLTALADALYTHVWELDGTISGEQGDGLSRTPYLEKQYGPVHALFQAVKHIFDPENILNPGKIVPTSPVQPLDLLAGAIYPVLPRKPDETHTSRLSAEVLDWQLDWQPDGIPSAVDICNHCGVCRIESGTKRMCPIFRFAPREEASPRAKTNLLRAVLSGHLDREDINSEVFKEIADLCVHCHMCRLECPAQVDVPRLMIEAKAAHIRDSGMKLGEWLLAHIDGVCAVGSRFRFLCNWTIKNRFMRWFIEQTLGISQGRKLPRFARRSWMQLAHHRKLTRPTHRGEGSERVAYFVDTYVNFFDVQLGEALVAVLEHNHIPVFVPPRQKYSAMTLIAHGAIEAARAIARHNVAILAEAVRQGYTIIATEPSAALALTHEYPLLIPDDEDVLLVARATREACFYLWKLHQRGQLRLDFTPLALMVGYHVPCHVKALEVGTPAKNLLGLVPGLRIETLEKGCSGMAGTYGLAKRNYRNSLRAGLPLINGLRQAPIDVGMTECCMCKMQMEHGMITPTTHPIKLLAFAYGLMPELGDALTTEHPTARSRKGRL